MCGFLPWQTYVENLAKPPILRAPGAGPGFFSMGLRLFFPPISSRTPQMHPQGPPAPHGGLRMHLLGHNLVPFGWSEKNHLNICLTWLKCRFSSSGGAHASSHHFPELVCTSLSSAPAANPIVLPPTKSLLFVSLAGGIWLSQTPPEQGPRLQHLLCCVRLFFWFFFFSRKDSE